MYCTAKTILRNDQDCADAVQETIMKAFLKIDTLKKRQIRKDLADSDFDQRMLQSAAKRK